MKNRVACCYLTHEHPEVMDEVLGKICRSYGEKGIDIYVYDSSTEDNTRLVVEKYRNMGLCSLIYAYGRRSTEYWHCHIIYIFWTCVAEGTLCCLKG